jgi:hypothetical protein
MKRESPLRGGRGLIQSVCSKLTEAAARL